MGKTAQAPRNKRQQRQILKKSRKKTLNRAQLKSVYKWDKSIKQTKDISDDTLAGYSPWKFPQDKISPRSAKTI